MSATDEILVDAHTHFHAGFDRRRFFDGALANFREAATAAALPATTPGCLMFTESRGCNWFERFRAEASNGGADADAGADPGASWSFAATAEDLSLWACARGGARLLLVAGRQLVTGEGLEVLALGCADQLDDGLELAAAVDRVLAAGAVPVIPWGFGKWWRGRGETLAALLQTYSAGRYFVGDNGGRWRGAPRPRLFEAAARHGVLLLPGSDPLPFGAQASRPGSCGFRAPVRLDEARPAASLLDWLGRCEVQPQTFGRYETLPRFVKNQVAMQLRKRSGRPTGGGAQQAGRGDAQAGGESSR